MDIDTSFCSADDTPGFWDGFWDRNRGLGAGGADPDALSPKLRRCHSVLWNRELPSGGTFELEEGYPYLTWNGHAFSSDSITTFFRWPCMAGVLEEAYASVPDHRTFVEDIVRRTYTIGGTVIFPRHRCSMNQLRGVHPMIRDRWDRSLECIRRYYSGEDSPLDDVMEKDSWFYGLFSDFRGYVDFFLLQDCVDADYNVVSMLGPMSFDTDPLPGDAEEYMTWVRNTLEFVDKRNERIRRLCSPDL